MDYAASNALGGESVYATQGAAVQGDEAAREVGSATVVCALRSARRYSSGEPLVLESR